MNFPVFESLRVDGYMLYPGLSKAPGIDIKFTAGPWLIIGVNGLGKSTLLLMLCHVLTGAVKARDAGFTGERSDVVSIDSKFFSYRVLDAARTATSSITVRFGRSVLSVTRNLNDLSIVEASLQNSDGLHTAATEDQYRDLLTTAMGLANFDDAIRVIDRVTFFLEAREPLIWDVAAQFELFRAILSPDTSQELRSLESAIVSADSAARNLNAAIFTITKRRNAQAQRHAQSVETRAQLAMLTAKQEEAEASELRLQKQQEVCDERRIDARNESKRADRAADEGASKYEKLKYEVLRHAFAGVPPNDQYVFLKIMTERVCIACGNGAAATAADLERRKQKDRCLVCGLPRKHDDTVISTAATMQARANTAYEALVRAREEQERLKLTFSEAEAAYEKADQLLEESRRVVDSVRREVRRIRSRLPEADQAELSREEDRVETLKREVATLRKERDQAEEKIGALIASLSIATEAIRERLVTNFQNRADAYFAEKVRLVYAQRKARIGQTGQLFDFPAFEVEMTSGATQSQFIRRRADQVSFSQREYLDMIFRVSLIETLSTEGGSFVVDGPEGSLDAVFAERAGNLFAKLSMRSSGNTVIIACNVVDGQFIPNTLREYRTPAQRRARLVNLLDLAIPTTALTELRGRYRGAVDAILALGAR